MNYMKQLIFLAIGFLLFSSCKNQQQEKIAATLYDTLYQPAVFADPARLEKIKQTFAIVDKIYKDYADSNHFPGLSFGIVVDGKLVYTGNYGYTDI